MRMDGHRLLVGAAAQRRRARATFRAFIIVTGVLSASRLHPSVSGDPSPSPCSIGITRGGGAPGIWELKRAVEQFRAELAELRAVSAHLTVSRR